MPTRFFFSLLILSALVAGGAAIGFSEDEKPKPMSETEMWAKAAELAKPGEMHKHLAFLAGTWKVAGKMFTGMGEIPFTGESTYRWVLGDRFLELSYEGPGMAEKMVGRGLLGYDNGSKVYQQTWAMTMGTGITFSTGTYDAEKKTFTFHSKALGPDGIMYRARETVTITSNDEYVTASYASEDKDGAPERKEMEMTCTRVK
jgi:hypothetical protein